MEPLTIVVLVGVGVVAGVVNTLAGGGSFLALPAFIFAGLPAPVANGTNRVAVLLQALVGAWAMHRRVPFEVGRALRLAVPTVVAALAGAYVATLLDAGQMRVAIGVALLSGAVLMVVRPQRWLQRRLQRRRPPSPAGSPLPAADTAVELQQAGAHEAAPGAGAGTPQAASLPADAHTVPEAPRRSSSLATVAGLLAVGFYGGFLQAGVGALLVLVLAGPARLELLEATGAKNILIACFTLASLVVFAVGDAVEPVAGLTMGLGSVVGAELGARLAVRGGKRLISAALIVALVLAALRLLGVF